MVTWARGSQPYTALTSPTPSRSTASASSISRRGAVLWYFVEASVSNHMIRRRTVTEVGAIGRSCYTARGCSGGAGRVLLACARVPVVLVGRHRSVVIDAPLALLDRELPQGLGHRLHVAGHRAAA